MAYTSEVMHATAGDFGDKRARGGATTYDTTTPAERVNYRRCLAALTTKARPAPAERSGLPGREGPRRLLGTTTRQRPVDELPLLSQERDARARAMDAAQADLVELMARRCPVTP